MNEKEAKEMHILDADMAIENLLISDIDENIKAYRTECLKEFITMIETGKTDHINANEDGKRIEHFK